MIQPASISSVLTVDVSISEELGMADEDVPEPSMLQTWAAASYVKKSPAVASILVASAKEIQQLNKQYRDKDKATNVLSFPMGLPDELEINLLGDIVLCAVVIKKEAALQDKSEHAHWAHMVVHGMLHLQGYDHVKDDDAEKMEKLETSILNQLGFDNPY
jgi:probable rRNA maturation factor